jgi:hypothetical protein
MRRLASLAFAFALSACTSSSGGPASTATTTATATTTGTTTATGAGGATSTTTATSTSAGGAGGAATTTTGQGGAGGAATTTTGQGGAGGATWTSACAAGLAVEVGPVIDGLLYTSESDYPFESWSANDPGTGPISPEHLLVLLGLPADTKTETRTVDELFQWPLQGPDGARYQQLHDLLLKRLTDVAVIRVFDPANQAEVHVYLVGRTGCAEVAGVRTISIET